MIGEMRRTKGEVRIFGLHIVINPSELRLFRLYSVVRLLMFLKFHGYAMPLYVKTYYLAKRMMRKGRIGSLCFR